ncbi:phenylalanine--tRNA ligase subunit beta [Porphyromonas pogonae]|uniref:phenylalanine--tRNA ligase subunit beta n=1 Tax=Porphyromonas pogonae TaxID=867595 RepID=UPI002E79E737|nr:phenylalanine--tRNA ligase subunit beta [Porphyromonas pogonae]
MNISYKWLKEYVNTSLKPQEIADALTSIGLETGSVDEVETIPGGLKGLVIGEVLTCEAHPNSDHLHLTTVNIGEEAPLKIVCGAPNVQAGKAVVVATIGSVLGSGDEKFTIKKSKIRGEESFGMLCSQVEIGVGHDNSGIILLDLADVTIGMPAAEYFGVESDYCLEVDITPNRVDATSHFGVARELAAYLTQHVAPVKAILPETAYTAESVDKGAPSPITVEVEDSALCPRFQGVVIRGVKVGDSPEWLRNRLTSIGLKPINNIVDITNFVLHEAGQPLHAYDLSHIKGSKLIVAPAREGDTITTLDGVERKLTANDLVIADGDRTPLCIAGVMGGLVSGTVHETTDIFLESANFNPTSVRKTARRFGINSDSSFRFERGLDANRTTWSLLRAASLITEIAGGSIDGGIADFYPSSMTPHHVEMSIYRFNNLVGQEIPLNDIKSILGSLDIEILSSDGDKWTLAVPRYRVDVTRDVDVAEEIMRIYGYNSIELSGYIRANLSFKTDTDKAYHRQLLVSEQLVGAGFNEILNNSLTAEAYYTDLTTYPAYHCVKLMNPLSQELNSMRQTLLFGGLETISHNMRRQQNAFYLFEWGACYSFNKREHDAHQDNVLAGYDESQRLGIWTAGKRVHNSWAHQNEDVSPFELKAMVENIFTRLGICPAFLKMNTIENEIFAGHVVEIRSASNQFIGYLGEVSPALTKQFDINMPVYFAELDWAVVNKEASKYKLEAKDLPKYPQVKRDLALLLDKHIPFVEVEDTAYKCEKNLLKRCELFDVYEGKNLPAGKKSYAVSFYLQDDNKTMSDKQIDAIMQKIRKALEMKLGAELR